MIMITEASLLLRVSSSVYGRWRAQAGSGFVRGFSHYIIKGLNPLLLSMD